MPVFFGYGRCESVCPVDLRRMTEAVDLRGEVGREVAAPIPVTVDPGRDRPQARAGAVAAIHPRLIGGGAQGVQRCRRSCRGRGCNRCAP